MYLKRIQIRNFRVFDEAGVEIVFNKGVNAIIGENNSGKSSIIDAIRIAFSTVPYKKDVFFNRSDFHIGEDGSTAEWAQFDIFLEEVPPYLIEIWNPETKISGEFHIRFSLYKAANGMEKVKSSSWGIGTEGNPISSDTFEAIEIAFLGALRDSENEMKPSRNSKLAQLLRNIVPEESERDELVKLLQSANSSLLEKEQLIKARDAVNQNLSRIEQEVLQQQIDIGLVEPRFDSIAGSLRAWVKPKWVLISTKDPLFEKASNLAVANMDCHSIHTSVSGVHIDLAMLNGEIEIDHELLKRILQISSHTFELYQNGLGYNNLLFMSAVLGDMSIQKPGVFQNLLLIEEPEAHLHPQLQELVQRFLVNTGKDGENIQVIYTSHSPTLVSKVGIENVNLLYEVNHQKRSLPLASTMLKDPDKVYLEKYLDVTKSQMFFAKGILFVEGICEALIIPELAKIIKRPLDKYAVEIVNLNSVAFKPFVNLFTAQSATQCFEKISIITDDDRCTDKTDADMYIDKNIDYDDISDDIVHRIKKGKPSSRFVDIADLCKNTTIKPFGATKTLEFALAFCDNNVLALEQAIKEEFPIVGKTLGEKLSSLKTNEEKAACIWLFIRYRDSSKGAIAQSLCNIIQRQQENIENGVAVENAFEVPEYIKNAIYAVTEK
jgi:putative ATP-dependent endonuclease of OLD family